MTALDRLVPTPRLLELDHIDLASPPDQVWEVVRHLDLAQSPWIRLLFSIRTLPSRIRGQQAGPAALHIDDLVSSPEKPGFRILVEDPPHEVALGAIGKVWEPSIPFVHMNSPEAFAAFDDPDFAKVAWALRVVPRGERDSRVEVEVRVDTTDDAAWQKFRRYFRFIGIGSRFIRHSLLASFARRFGTPDGEEQTRLLPGDELVPDALAQDTQGITIAATPEAIWPWLLQMGCGRGGYYSYDLLDNGNQRSATEIHPELAQLAVGDVIPARPNSEEGFEVLRIEAPHALVLGGLYDLKADRQLPFYAARPDEYGHMTWSFVLEPLDATSTRLAVRVRAALSTRGRRRLPWIVPLHRFMEAAQLRNLAARAEGRLPREGWRDVAAGVGGAAVAAAALLTPFLRDARSHWGVDREIASRKFPGDELVPSPRWGWTHGIEIEASADSVWPWVAQIGADRGGFYSYQWLENLAGCEVRNAERIHLEWQLAERDELRLHPSMPPLRIVDLVPGRYLVAHAPPDEVARATGKRWAAVSWLFFLEPLGPHRCRLLSRYRCATSSDLASLVSLGPTFVEPIGFAMDRRMLRGIKERAERPAKPLLHADALPAP